MAMDFDSQLIESVEVRRNRLTASLLYGANPTERRWKDRTRLLIYGVIATAVICALCVAISFVVQILTNWLSDREERERQQQERQQEMEQRDQERRQQEEQQRQDQSQGSAPTLRLPAAHLSANPAAPTDLSALTALPIAATTLTASADPLERC
ncbi:hypothetical protein [Micrococcus terreus]|uniref:Uncharacterized protein n=1 Tax=Micrococcus terreus TaxID=574650 RepID=A0A1I7MDP3_9MICC|nr:hypothetical protein [Micrococcus terreus]SFV20046.1 hypothetical protein SAMN04487966_10159 [Micrococcus terreus]